MSINEMEKKIASLKEWEDLLEEAKVQVEALKDEIKAEMLSRNTEELTAGRYICRWTSLHGNQWQQVHRHPLRQKSQLRFCQW